MAAIKNGVKIHVTKNHTGKMEGMWSISTCCLSNINCQIRSRVPGSVCEKCFAQQMMKYRTNMKPAFERNGEILSSDVIPIEFLPFLNACYFRFESFGDLINENHLINYFNICEKNPDVHFALWTKNLWIVRDVVEVMEIKKPKNLVIIASSPFINVKLDISRMPYIDKVFTVYTREYADEHGIIINCGAKHCLSCHRCYKKCGAKEINEILKSDSNKKPKAKGGKKKRNENENKSVLRKASRRRAGNAA